MTITDIYYDDINDIIDNAGWAERSRDAQRLALQENNASSPRVINEAVFSYMKRKIDSIEKDYPFSKRRYTTHGTWLRQLPKVTAVDFENGLTFAYLREFW